MAAPGILAICIALLCVATDDARAGAWLLPEDTWSLIVPFTRETADEFRDADGDVVDGPDFSKVQVRPFFEYGLRSWFTVGASGDWQRMQQDFTSTGSESAGGLASIEFHGRARLWSSDAAVASGQFTLILPGGLDTANPFFPSGATQVARSFGAEMRLLAGHGGLLRRGFVEAQLAARFMEAPLQDELRYDLTAGWGAPADWLFLGQLFGIEGIGGQAAPAVGFDLVKLQVGVVRGITPDVSIQLAVERAVAGRDTVAGGSWILALWWTP